MAKIIRIRTIPVIITSLLAFTVMLSSCDDFLNPEQELYITDDRLYNDWYEYRSVAMGMYGLAQNLVEQIVILGELRGDLLEITPYADPELVEIYNFNVSRGNRYASPTNFFKLIQAANNLIRVLEKEQPQVLDPESPITNFDRLYGEALCMRAWAYFKAVQIYGKIPYIDKSLVTMEEIEAFVTESELFDTEMIVNKFTHDLETRVKAVGVNHYVDNQDESWGVTVWNTYAMHTLLGQMYLTIGDFPNARTNFEKVIYHTSHDETRYQLDFTFGVHNWRNIFMGVDNREHILTIPFSKATFQQNEFQSLFNSWGPHSYQLKPTKNAIDFWETVWRTQIIARRTPPSRSEMSRIGQPTDFHRGFGHSYVYMRGSTPLEQDDFTNMITLRVLGDDVGSRNIMEGVDTVVFKYNIGKSVFDQDADFIIYRAADVHLYMAEAMTYLNYRWAMGYLNDGAYDEAKTSMNRSQLGVRGRVGIGLTLTWNGRITGRWDDDQIGEDNIVYIHDPYTNEIIGFMDFTGNLPAKQRYFVDQVLNERARELAFEGKRFFDLMRIAHRRNDPSYLAGIVSSKFPAGQREQMYNLLLDPGNWYINYFE